MDKKTLFQQFVSFVTDVHQVKHEYTKDLSVEDLTPVQYGILEFIAVSEPVTLSEISYCKDLSAPNASRELKKLTDKELCVKTGAKDDRRKQLIRLTAQGEAYMDKVFRHMEQKLEARIGEMTDRELEQISEAMRLLQTTVFQPELKLERE